MEMDMSVQWYYFTLSGGLNANRLPPVGSRPFLEATSWLQPALLDALNRSFHAWGAAHLSPGIVTPERIWITVDGTVAFQFAKNQRPAAQSAVGAQAGLAAWLVLLDRYVDREELLSQARKQWSVNELVGTLPFITPPLLPHSLLQLSPNNWEHVARALAKVVVNAKGERAMQQ
jgi:hypothetical protein